MRLCILYLTFTDSIIIITLTWHEILQKFLTDHGFTHRDLSTRNVLIGDRLNIKIANPGI